MPDFLSLEQSLRRMVRLAAGAGGTLLAISILSVAFAAHTVWSMRRAGQSAPVLVVPGAVGGVYSAGLTEDNVLGVARYLAGLGTNFSGVLGMDARFDELESFASADYLPRLQSARKALRREVETQNQSRVFYGSPGREQLKQSAPGRFDYILGGQRLVYASGLPMDQRNSTVRLKVTLGTPSQKNRAGIALDGFEVSDGPAGAVAR